MQILLSIILAVLLLLPLCLRLRIKLTSGILGSIIIGSISALITHLILQFVFLDPLLRLLTEVIIILSLAAAISLYRFYRDPDREVPQDQNIIVSPADGRISYIKEIKEGRLPVSYKKKSRNISLEELTKTNLIKDSYLIIGTQLSLIDVHVNRIPISGRVILQKYIPGKFISLRNAQAPFLNERLTTIIDQGLFQIGVVQIASHLVNRIQSYIKSGQTVEIGQRFGIIKFGSQVDLIIPRIENLKINVGVGDQVKAGITIIAEYDGENNG